MDEIEIEKRLTTVEESTKSAHHRITAMEAMQKEIRDLALSVNTLAGTVKTLCTDMCDATARISKMEQKPAQRWEQMIGDIIKLAITGAVGYYLGMIK